MNVTNLILLVILILGELACLYIAIHTKEIAKDNAVILKKRKMEYEAEKGKNLATKEDIEEITRKVEDVRSAVSLSRQKEYELQTSQERILLGILEDATRICVCYLKLHIYLNDKSTRVRLDKLVENTNDILAHFRYLCNLAIISIHVDGIDDEIDKLVEAVIDKCTKISITATNAANIVDMHNVHLGFISNPDLPNEIRDLGIEGLRIAKQQSDDVREKTIPEQDDLLNAIRNYSKFMESLYGKELFLFKA